MLIALQAFAFQIIESCNTALFATPNNSAISDKAMWQSYLMTDLIRVAEFLALPLTWPVPDPVGQTRGENGRLQTNVEQPCIRRLTMLGIIAEEQGHGIKFADEVSRLIWSGTENWQLGDHLKDAASRCGLSLDEMDKQLESQKDPSDNKIQSNQKAHDACGHWGVPTFGYNGQAFIGQDRLDVLLWALQKDGLTEK